MLLPGGGGGGGGGLVPPPPEPLEQASIIKIVAKSIQLNKVYFFMAAY